MKSAITLVNLSLSASLLTVLLGGCAASPRTESTTAASNHSKAVESVRSGAPAAVGIELTEITLQAETARQVIRGVFDMLDCDLDGTVEQAEVDEHFAQIWLPADRDASRSLDAREFLVLQGGLTDAERQRHFARADGNRNGEISPSELRRHLAGLIEQIDDDGDLELSRADLGLPSWN